MSTRTRILLAMIVSMALGYMPWYNFSAVLKYIAADFRLTSADTGMILAAFQAGYVLVVPFTGWLADRVGLKRVLLWATLGTALFSTAFAFGAQDRWSTLALRLATGLSAGAIYVPGLALLSRWFSPAQRGGALGAYTGALVAAYAGGYFVAAPMAAASAWRNGIRGMVADRKGRTMAIVVAASMSLAAELVLGYLYGQHLLAVVLVAAWIGFWAVADSAVYKAGLTEMVLPTVRGTYLGFQSATGFFMTILAPVAFGMALEYFNGPTDPTRAVSWGPAFLLLGLGALLAPAASLFLRLQPQAKLMSDGKR